MQKIVKVGLSLKTHGPLTIMPIWVRSYFSNLIYVKKNAIT